MQGQDFLSASLSGFAGSLGASAWSSAFDSKGVSMIAFGAFSGGVASELSGGNFWKGAITGGIVAGLNHAMHRLEPDNGYDKNGKRINYKGGKETDYLYDKNGKIIASTSVEIIEEYSEFPTYKLDEYGKRWVRAGGGLYDPSWDR